MALAGISKVVLGSIAFGVFWVMAVFPAVPFLPIGRTAGSLLGALLMIVFRVLKPSQAYAAIDLSILCLLFGTMVVSIYLEKAHMFHYLGRLLSWKSFGGRDLLVRVCLISAIASAFFTNDTTCIVLTEFILNFTNQHDLPPLPFLLALASSANIGSSATPIGNPQNLVIAIQSKIPFGKFLIGILPAMLVGLIVNTTIILCMFWRSLSQQIKKENVESSSLEHQSVQASAHKFSPARMSRVSTPDVSVDGEGLHIFSPALMSHPADGEVAPAESRNSDVEKQGKLGPEADAVVDDVKRRERRGRRRAMFMKGSVYVVTIGMLAALLAGLDMPWTAITAAIVLVVIDFRDAGPCLEKVRD